MEISASVSHLLLPFLFLRHIHAHRISQRLKEAEQIIEVFLQPQSHAVPITL